MPQIPHKIKPSKAAKPMKLTIRPKDVATIASSVALDANLTNAEKAMYLILATYATAEGECRLQQRTIADHYGCSLRFTRSLLMGLRSKGCIRWERRKHYNFYQILR
jgi:hypothetical protein